MDLRLIFAFRHFVRSSSDNILAQAASCSSLPPAHRYQPESGQSADGAKVVTPQLMSSLNQGIKGDKPRRLFIYRQLQ